MRTKVFLGLFLLIGIVACENQSEDSPDYFPLSIGSYWVYNSYDIDSLGNETLISENDTLIITGDTIIRGNEYAVFYGKHWPVSSWPEERYLRDSSGYIVDLGGDILLTQNNFTDTLNKVYSSGPGNITYLQFSRMETLTDAIIMPVDTFDRVLNKKITVIQCDPGDNIVGSIDCLFAPNVGNIMKQCFYISRYQTEKRYFEQRLMDYYIAP